mmetsp:Transcript_1072/g.3144  ORF Transcript_1072/g.3144 Transcript_1072/m.3144 type:complete len:185 (-) Transcript_1072:42-596(-)
MTRSALLCALAASSAAAFLIPTSALRSPSHRFVETQTDAEKLMAEAAALRAEASQLEGSPVAAAPAAPAEMTPEQKTQNDIENRKKIAVALRAATKSRDKEQIQICLATAEKAGFSGKDEDVRAAVVAYNELNELSDVMRKKLTTNMKKSDPMSSTYEGGGNLYAGIFALVAVLVIAGGKDILY